MESLQRLYMCRKCCKPARKKTKKTLPFTNVWIHVIKKRKIPLHWATWPPQHHSRCLPCQGTWGRISWLVWSILDSAQVWSPGLLEGHPGQVAGGHRPSISTQTRTQWVWGRGSKEKETDKTSWDGRQTMLPLHATGGMSRCPRPRHKMEGHLVPSLLPAPVFHLVCVETTVKINK